MKKISYAVLMAILFVGFTGCGDDSSTGPDVEENPPEIPDLTEVAQPDVSFFDNNNPQKMAVNELNETNNYYQARNIVLWNTALFSFGQTYGTFLSQADQEQASFNNGVWEWSYSYNYEGLNATYRTTAKDVGNEVEWATYWSYSDGQGGGYEDYNIFKGTISNDESSGNWTFNAMDADLEEEIPFITSTWDYVSDTEGELTLVIYGEAIDDENSNETATIHYEQSGTDYSMELNFADGENYLVTWNADTNVGSVTNDGETVCWDENFQDVPCE